MPLTLTVPLPPSVFFTDFQSTTSITFSWNEPDDGGSTIIDYEIDWNKGDTINQYVSLTRTTGG